MSKATRNFFEGGMYHIIQRGNNKTYIFDDQLDKAMFLNIIKETMAKLPFDMLYYVLMDNHYHLLLCMKKDSIAKIMHKINLNYSKYYNQKYNRTGTIFGTRYTCVDIKDTRQYMTVILYNAYNPVKAKIVKHPEEYRWCAHLEVVSSHRSIINRKKMLQMIDKDESKARELYQLLLSEKIKGIKREKADDEIKEIREEVMMTILREICGSDINARDVLDGNRTSVLINLKKCAIEAYLKQGFKPLEIALFLNMSVRRIREYKSKF